MIRCGNNRFSEHSPNKGNSKRTKKRWRCTKVAKGCKAYILTFDDVVIMSYNEHNH